MIQHMSAQARRRFNRCLYGREIMDLAAEIADTLEAQKPSGYAYGEAERNVILSVLVRQHGDCEWCGKRSTTLVARLDADRDQSVCQECHDDPRVPTTYFPA
ncbi:MAG TPA: hypothetical protein VG476_02445 [Acidimicrobiales bacterium]|nr:hypothetical protein [Acidimicrobiales bacterium]